MRTLACIIPAIVCLLVCASTNQNAAPGPAPQPTVVTFHESGLPRTLDPHKAGDVVSTRHTMHIYETLLEYAPFGEARLQPCLAASMPVYDAEKLTYTFSLRDDIYFADHECFPEGKGRRVTAEDVVYSIKRLAALPDSGGFWVIEGAVKGLDEFRAQAIEHVRFDKPRAWLLHLESDVEGVTAVDEMTVRFTLNHPNPQFLYAITLSYGAIVPKEAARKHDFEAISGEEMNSVDMDTRGVGTGPYRVKEYGEELIVYERNMRYRNLTLADVPESSSLKRVEGAQFPLTDVLRYRIIPDSAESFDAFVKKELPISGLDREQFEEVIDFEARKAGKTGDDLLREKYRNQGIHVREYLEPTLHYISFNMNDKTFGAPAGDKGRALRKAVAMCIDRQTYIDRFLNGRGEPADQLVPPSVQGRDDRNTMKNQKFDVEGARKLLKEAGFALTEDNGVWTASLNGKQVELQVLFRSTSEATKDYAVWLAEAVGAVGINMEPKLLTFAEFLKHQDEGEGQAYDAGWVMDYPDAQNMLQLLYGPNKSPGINSAAFADTSYDKLHAEMALLRDDVPKEAARKKDLIIKMHEVLDAETPWVLMEYRKIFTLHHDGYASPPPNPFAYNHRKYVRWIQ